MTRLMLPPFLVSSMDVDLSIDVLELPTSQLMCKRLREHYELMSDSMYLSVVHQAQFL